MHGLNAAIWERLVALAQSEGMAPLLYWSVQSGNWPVEIAAATRDLLTTAYYESTAYNALLFQELKKVLAILKDASISVVVLKGAVLAPTLYPTIGVRPMVDLDLLVRSEDLGQVKQIFRAMGYKNDIKEQAPGLHQMADYHLSLIGGPGMRVTIELHWGLVASPLAWYAIPMDWFWQHTEPWRMDSGSLQLTPVAHLLYLAGHTLLQHGGSQALLIWLYDIHLLAQSGLVTWNELVEQAGNLHWGGVIEQALRQAQAAFSTNLPDGILERLAQDADQDLTRLVKFKQRFGGVRLLYDWYSLMALRGIPQMRYAFGMVFPQPAYIRWRYQPRPAWLWPLCYPYRWIRMLVEAVEALRRGILRAVIR